jgi:hypothetical protein
MRITVRERVEQKSNNKARLETRAVEQVEGLRMTQGKDKNSRENYWKWECEGWWWCRDESAHHHWSLHGLLARQKDSVRLNSALCTECKHVDTDW